MRKLLHQRAARDSRVVRFAPQPLPGSPTVFPKPKQGWGTVTHFLGAPMSGKHIRAGDTVIDPANLTLTLE
jgi:hypothetical protein